MEKIIRHLINLLLRAWHSLVSALGTTTLAVLVAILVVLGPIATTFLIRLRGSGWKLTRNDIREALKQSWKSGVVFTITIWLVLFAGSVVLTIYSDHNELVAANDALRAFELKSQGEIVRLKEETAALIIERDRLNAQLLSKSAPVPRRPEIKILRLGNELAGSTLPTKVDKNGGFGTFELRIKNVGDASTPENYTIRLKFNADVASVASGWQMQRSLEGASGSDFLSINGPAISPGDHRDIFFSGKFIGEIPTQLRLVWVQLSVYYGQPKPSSASFTLVVEPLP